MRNRETMICRATCSERYIGHKHYCCAQKLDKNIQRLLFVSLITDETGELLH